MKSKGFTLIEMLIVIAVIGVLAIAVLSAINPVEQMRKARDTRRRSNAAELLNGVERYYATNEVNPPALITAAGADDDCATAVAAGAIAGADLTDLVTANELKTEFVTRIDTAGNELYVGIDPTDDLTAVCYLIEAQSNKTKYATAPNHCQLAGPPVEDYVCVPE